MRNCCPTKFDPGTRIAYGLSGEPARASAPHPHGEPGARVRREDHVLRRLHGQGPASQSDRQDLHEEPLPEQVAQDFIGGAGFTVKYLFDEVPADCDPLGPENKLIYACGPFTGTRLPCASRMAVNAKSPATGAMGVAMTGGHFPVELKRAGYDVLIIEGRAEKPTYLWIKDGEVTFRDAADLWGLTTTDCQQVIKDELQTRTSASPASARPARSSPTSPASSTSAGWPGARAWAPSWAPRTSRRSPCAATCRWTSPTTRRTRRPASACCDAMKDSPVLYSEFATIGTSGNVDNSRPWASSRPRTGRRPARHDFPEKIGGEAVATRGVGQARPAPGARWPAASCASPRRRPTPAS